MLRNDANPATSDRAGSLRELLSVALPLVISYASTALMYMFDRVFLSRYSVEALAASLPAGVLHYNLAALAIGTLSYITAFVGQYAGADQRERIGPVLWQGVYLSLISAALMLCSLPFAPAAFAWFDHGDAIAPLELAYYRIMCFASLPLFLGTTLSCFYSGRGRTTVVMVVNIISTLINIGFDYVLIFGLYGFPEMGIEGAALGTLIGFSTTPILFALHMACTQRHSAYRLWSGWRLDRELFARMLRFGLPSGFQQFLDVGCFTVFIQLIGRLGTEQLSATSLVFNLNSLTFIPLLGLGTAVTSLVGQRIGDGRPHLAVRTTWLAAGVATAYVAAFVSLYLFTPDLILRPYGLDEHLSLRELVTFLLKIVALYSFFDALVVVFSSAIRGAGDTRCALVFSVSMGVLVLVLPTYVASHFGPAGFTTAWYALVAYLVVCAGGFMARFQQGKWMAMRVIEHTLPELAAESADIALEGAAS